MKDGGLTELWPQFAKANTFPFFFHWRMGHGNMVTFHEKKFSP